ncbi:unnamed protein product [Rotaria sordida]|uniref:Uncharacterized protein n=1 Tax=Rotaria sordida TaxID=392033 RepID=A0A815QJ36_9BILA|nr:unnamed protein product [Rotaria sordida]
MRQVDLSHLPSSLLSQTTAKNLDSTSHDNNVCLEFSYNQTSYYSGGVTDLQEDYSNSSDFNDANFSISIKSSSAQQIHQKESFTTNIQSLTAGKKIDLVDLIESISVDGSSLTTVENLDSIPYNNNMYSKVRHNEKAYNADDFIDSQQNFLNSSGFIDDKYSSLIESSSIKQIHQKDCFQINNKSLTARKKVDFDDLIEIIDTDGSSPTTAENLDLTSDDNHIYSKICRSENPYNTGDVCDSQTDLINSSSLSGPEFLSPIESSFIPPLAMQSLFARSPQIEPSFISSASIQSSSVEQIHPEKSSKTQISRLRSRYSTKILRPIKNHNQYPIDDKKKSFLYDDSFSELCGWLENLLRGGFLVSLVIVKEKYEEILQLRNEMITEGMIRTTSIRDRLHTKFKNRILFTKVSNRQGLFISWNDLSTITQSTLTNSSALDYNSSFQSSNIYKDQENVIDKEAQSKILFEAIELLRESIHENMHYLKQVRDNSKSLAEFTAGLFWDCIPTLMKNVIGLLTTNDDYFQRFKSSFEYSNIFNEDMYKSCEKALKISSIAYDIINARYDSYSTPKHLMLGNELYHQYDPQT